VTTDATVLVAGAVVVTDPDTGQTVTVTIAAAPANGTATVAQDGSFTYQPTGTWTGQDSFTIQGCDDNAIPACSTGTVTVAVYPVAVPDAGVTSEGETVEVDVQANDIGDAGAPQIITPPANGTATIGSIIYTPDTGFAGTDQVVYRICSPNDQTLCDDATLTITVSSDAPPTDADQAIATPLGPVGSGMLQLAGMLALLLVSASCAAAFLRQRRPTG
ncbi:MAG TPA: Ig-like domain-containing protein, partial [Candidatus Limnocylindrales bacterium]